MQTLRVDERVHCMTVFIKGKLFASKPNQKWVRKKTLCADYICLIWYWYFSQSTKMVYCISGLAMSTFVVCAKVSIHSISNLSTFDSSTFGSLVPTFCDSVRGK